MKTLMLKTLIFVALMIAVAFPGCRTFRPDYSLSKSEHEKRIDELWRQGYGYNNPNVDRKSDLQEPTNFDGKPNTLGSAAKGIGEQAIGNAITFAIFEGVPAFIRGISKKLSR